jgi:hypothetical protein
MKYQDVIKNPSVNKEFGYLQGSEMYYGQERIKVAKGLAEIKGQVVKRKAKAGEQDFWESIPTISADAQVGDVVKDYSINSDGQAGVVVDVRDAKKRTGDIVTVVEFVFYGHTNLKELRTRKIEFKKSEKVGS